VGVLAPPLNCASAKTHETSLYEVLREVGSHGGWIGAEGAPSAGYEGRSVRGRKQDGDSGKSPGPKNHVTTAMRGAKVSLEHNAGDIVLVSLTDRG